MAAHSGSEQPRSFLDPAVTAAEPVIDLPSSKRTWVMLLAGPVIWMTYFLAVYLLAEDACAGVTYGTVESLSEPQLRTGVLIATVAGVVLCVAHVWWVRSVARSEGSFATRVGSVLSFGGAIATVVVGVPVVWIGPC